MNYKIKVVIRLDTYKDRGYFLFFALSVFPLICTKLLLWTYGTICRIDY